MDMNRMTVKLQEALQTASGHALRRSHQGVDVDHLLLALLEQEGGLAAPLIEQAGLSVPAVRAAVERAITKIPQVQGPGAAPGQIHLTTKLASLLARAEKEMEALRDDYLSVEHVLLAAADEGGVFRQLGLTRDRLLGATQQV